MADLDKSIARAYGVVMEESVALCGLFLIDKEGLFQHARVSNPPLGRDVDEAPRILDARTCHEAHGDVCPANWRKGEHAMAPNAQGVAQYLATPA